MGAKSGNASERNSMLGVDVDLSCASPGGKVVEEGAHTSGSDPIDFVTDPRSHVEEYI